MMPNNADLRRLNPSSAARWETCAGDVLPLHSLETRHQTLARDGERIRQIQAEEAIAARRKLSPRFPGILEAEQRRRNDHMKLIARVLLVLAAIFLVIAPFAAHPWFCILASAACGLGFCGVCYTSAQFNKDRTIVGPH